MAGRTKKAHGGCGRTLRLRSSPDGGTLAQGIRDTADSITNMPGLPLSELRGRMSSAAAAIEAAGLMSATRDLYSVISILVDSIIEERREENTV